MTDDLDDVDGLDDLDGIDQRLRADGGRRRELTVVDRVIGTGIDVDDVRRRSSRQARRQHLAGGLAVAAAFVLSAGAVTAAARSLVVSDPPVARPPDPTVTSVDPAAGSPGSTRAHRYAAPGSSSSRPGPTSTGPTSTTSTTAPPTTVPSSTPTTTGSTAGQGIRSVDLSSVARSAGECSGRDSSRKADVAVARVAYGNVVGDDRDDAVVTVSCPGSATPVHASVYTLESTAPSGVKRVSTVEPDPPTRALLSAQLLTGWNLSAVSIDGTTVESLWTANRRGDKGASPPYTFTLRQRWTGFVWALIAPLHLSPPSR